MVTKKIRKTASMKLIEFAHKECCGNSIDKIILRKLEEHRGGFRKVAETLSQACDSDFVVQPLSNSTITMWVIRLGIEHEVGLIRKTFGKTQNLDLSEYSDPTSELTASGNLRVQESISGPCLRCEAVYDLLEDQTLLSVQKEETGMVLVINAKELKKSEKKNHMVKHWFPLSEDKIKEYIESDHESAA